MKEYVKILGKLAALAIFIFAVWLLYHKLRRYSLAEIEFNLRQIPPLSLLLSLLLMALNYMVLVGYDWLALKAIHKQLGMGRVCLVSFVGCVISYNFGALLGGSTVRYRLYSAWGFSALDIVRLVLMLAVTFWVGAMGLAGLIFLFVPLDIPLELGINPALIRPLGMALISVCLLYLGICAFNQGRSFRCCGKEFALPSLPIAGAQTLVAGLDQVVAAFCLYVLLPHYSELSFLEFLPNYLLAQVSVVLSHVPGGMGVLEIIIMNLTRDIPAQEVFAGVLAFRIIYYLLPLMIAAIMLGAYELYLRRHETDAFVQDVSCWLRDWMPTLLGYAVFLAGAVICISVVVPISPRSLLILRPHIPLWMLEATHTLTGMVGVALLVLACGLQRRKRMVWKLTVITLSVGVFSNLCQGVDWPEALLLLTVLFPLTLSRYSFGRANPVRGTYPIQWMGAVALVMICSTLLGLYFAGLPTGSDNFLHIAYSANSPRILRTLSAQILLLWILISLYLRGKLLKRRQSC